MPDHTTWTHFPTGADFQAGDLIWTSSPSGPVAHRIVRFEPYTHPVPATAAAFGENTRFAVCDDGYEVTLTANGSWPMAWEHTPRAYRERYLMSATSGVRDAA
jgi:hypothetical protein